LNAAGISTSIIEYDVPARTSAEAAAVLRCSVAQIAKSLVFRATSGAPVLVIASGANRVDEAKVSAVVGESVGRADAVFVRERANDADRPGTAAPRYRLRSGGYATRGFRCRLPTSCVSPREQLSISRCSHRKEVCDG
jgi:hypothetical protein